MTGRSTLEVRNLHFELGEDLPRFWMGGRRSVTTFYNNLSIFFPAGERFFIAAVKAHAGRVTDPRLQDEVRGFCQQEGIHSREHVRYNELLTAQGYPVKALEDRVKRLLQRVSRHTSPLWHLAITCALEHFTAILAHVVLADPRVLEGAHPAMAALWRWHAAEEGEHKHVAFDVYQAIGGGYGRRCFAMVLVTVSFWLRVFAQQARLMARDGDLASPREWWRLFHFLFVKPGGLATVWRPYLSYFRPSFHPWEHDDSGLIEAWKAQAAA